MIWRLGRTAIYFFMGWMLRFGRNLGSRTTHPSCLSTRGGALGMDFHIIVILSCLLCARKGLEVILTLMAWCIGTHSKGYGPTGGRSNIVTKWMRPGPGIWKSEKFGI